LVENRYWNPQPAPSLPPDGNPEMVKVVPTQTDAKAGSLVAVVGAPGCGLPSQIATAFQAVVLQSD
jgi:hypothetical protein